MALHTVHGKQLDILSGNSDARRGGRVLDVYYDDTTGRFRLEEACDNYYCAELSPEELIELGAELISAGTQRLTREV